jgi:hypothetical protein
MTKSRKSSSLKRGAVHGYTRQVPLVELMRLFATESVVVRLSVLLCVLGGEIVLNALMCLVRLSLVAMFLLATSKGIKHGVLALL